MLLIQLKTRKTEHRQPETDKQPKNTQHRMSICFTFFQHLPV